jgi:hypothetical protein
MGKTNNAYGILVGKSHGNRALSSPRRKWGDNIKDASWENRL